MTTAVRVALIGFTKFERATFESFFRLATKRTPAYVLCDDVADCQAAVVNADDEAGVAVVMRHGKLAASLTLGATAHPGAGAQLPRPINLMLVVRALDSLVQRLALDQPAAAPVSAQVQRVLDTLVSVTTALPAGVDTRALAASAASAATSTTGALNTGAAAPASLPAATSTSRTADPLALLQPAHGQHWTGAPRLADQPPPPPPAAAPAPASEPVPDRSGLDHILVVDDSDIALRFMANNLQRFGFQVHLARSGAEAIERVARRHFEFVFLDVMMEGLDGFHTCKSIKRSTYPDNRPPPTVVMLTSRDTAVDKLRGTMAGADAYLTKPLREADLLKVVGDREVAMHAYADTAHAASTLI
jgi:two-component system, cell cycle response regulator